MAKLRIDRLRFAALPPDTSNGAAQKSSRQTKPTHFEACPLDLQLANAIVEHIRRNLESCQFPSISRLNERCRPTAMQVERHSTAHLEVIIHRTRGNCRIVTI